MVASGQQPCTTPFSYIYCTSCPYTNTQGCCFSPMDFFQSVYGYIDNVYCANPGDNVGFCATYPNSTTVMVAAFTHDCSGQNQYAAERTLCCQNSMP
jgi:hypothetical protein